MKNILIFGGSFNPIHLGHEFLIKKAIENLNFDQFWLMPSYITNGKNMNSNLVKDRLNMCELVAKQIPNLKISKEEIKYTGISFTYNTVERIIKKHNKIKITLLMGADTFLTLENFKNFKQLFDMCEFIVVPRINYNLEELQDKINELKKYSCKAQIFNITSADISSCLIRENIKKGICVKALLNPGVFEYIKNKGLYTS